MKIQALAITSLFVAVGALQGQAQEQSSANAVGYVKKTFSAGFTLFSNPLVAEDNKVASLMPAPAAGTIVYKFNPATSGFVANSYLEIVPGLAGWLDDSMTLVPGEAAFISVPAGQSVDAIFVGTVAQGDLSTSFPAGFSLISSQVPQAGKISADLGLSVDNVNAVYTFDNASQGYTAFPVTEIPGVGTLFDDPAIAIGEGVFLDASAEGSWDRSFSVSE